MDVVHLSTADEMLTVTGDALRRTGAEGELTLGILWRLTHEPDAWGADVTLLAGVEGGTPVAVVTMTGPHPALIVGLGDDPGVDYAGFVEAMDAGPRPVGVNGAVRWVDPFARAWSEAGATTTLHREMRAFELLCRETASDARRDIPPGRLRRRRADGAVGDRLRRRHR